VGEVEEAGLMTADQAPVIVTLAVAAAAYSDYTLTDCNMVPDGVVTVRTSDDCASEPTSIRYPEGRNVLNPWIRES
jgi:hypothetical protein